MPQVKRQIYDLIVFWPVRPLVINGPAKSTPAFVKGAQSETLSKGRSWVTLNLNGRPSSFLQMVHLRICSLTSSHPRSTQYFWRKQLNVERATLRGQSNNCPKARGDISCRINLVTKSQNVFLSKIKDGKGRVVREGRDGRHTIKWILR